jgi:hypothetical protein
MSAQCHDWCDAPVMTELKINLFRDCQRVIYLGAQVSHGGPHGSPDEEHRERSLYKKGKKLSAKKAAKTERSEEEQRDNFCGAKSLRRRKSLNHVLL